MTVGLTGGPDKRRIRRTKAQIAALEQQIYEVLEADHPQSVRHVFYRMTDPRLAEPVEKSEQGYAQVQQRLALMRRRGEIPYGWITDATRRGHFVNTYRDHGEFLRKVAGLYRADLWQHADRYVEVWTESRSIAGVIEDDCEELAVTLYPSGGFTSMTLAYEAAEYINAATNSGEIAAEIVYIGDYDPAGVLIDRDIEAKLRAHLDQAYRSRVARQVGTPAAADDTFSLSFHRIAVTREQIAEMDLPTKPRKASDRRAKEITETVEAEAIPAAVLRDLLRQKVESFLPPRALQVAWAAEASERRTLLQLAAAAGG